MTKILSLFLLILVFAFSAINAQDIDEIQKILPGKYLNASYDNFGWSLDIDGDYAVVGSYTYNRMQGKAIVLHFNGAIWQTIAELKPSDAHDNYQFGYDVAIDGDNIVVGTNAQFEYGAVYVFTKPASGWKDTTETAKLSNPAIGTAYYYGASVDIDGDVIICGNQGYSYHKGQVDIFIKNGTNWTNSTTPDASLTSTSTDLLDGFGKAVAISGDNIVVGAYLDHSVAEWAGIAYVFTKPASGWKDTTETAILSASDIADNDRFGTSVAINDDVIAIGSEFDDDGATSAGAVYFYHKTGSTWTSTTETQKFSNPDITKTQEFGVSLDMDDSTIIVGFYGKQYHNYGGGAFILEKSGGTWSQRAYFSALYPKDSDYMGRSVGISNNKILIGAYLNDDKGKDAGCVYPYYKSSGWADAFLSVKVYPNLELSSNGDNFGNDIDIDGDYAVVGSVGNKSETGCAYVLEKDGNYWTRVAKLTASDGNKEDLFGKTVAISGDYIVIGAPYSDKNGTNSGNAYIFKKPSSGWTDMTETQQINVSENNQDDYFGVSVDIDSNIIIVGSSRALMKGRVYIYENISGTWTLAASLRSSTQTYRSFGYSVAIQDNYILVGCPNAEDSASYAGAAFVFKKPASGWTDTTENYKIIPPDVSASDKFGNHVEILDSTFVVGRAPHAKAIDIFEQNTYVAKLTIASTIIFGDKFAVSNDMIIVNGQYTSVSEYQQGVAYVYLKDGENWTSKNEDFIITASDASRLAHFGSAMVIQNDNIFITADQDFENGMMGGAVYYLKNIKTPTLQDSNIIISNITQNSANINWLDGDGNKRLVFITQDTSGVVVPVDNSDYVANTNFGSGDNIGNWYCVFNGTEHQAGVDVTNLSPETNYRVMVIEANSGAVLTKYLTSTASNNPLNFKTWMDLSGVGINVKDSLLYNTTAEMEYQTGGTKTWTPCDDSVTSNVVFYPGIISVREIDHTDNIRNIDTLTVSPATTYTINFITETTNEAISSEMEYNFDNDFSTENFIGDDTAISLTPGTNVYIRKMATQDELPSEIFPLIVPQRPTAPTNGIVDDINNTFDWTNNPDYTEVTDYEFSVDSGYTWQLCFEKPITIGDTNLSAGRLNVRVSASNENGNERFVGNILQSDTNFTVYVKIDENSLNAKIFPNPVSNILKIDVTGNYEVKLFTSTGKLVFFGKNISEINVKNLEKGTYLIKIITKKDIFTQTVIVN